MSTSGVAFLAAIARHKLHEKIPAIDMHLLRYIYQHAPCTDAGARANLAASCLVLYQAQQQGHSALPYAIAFENLQSFLQGINLPIPDSITAWLTQLLNTQWATELHNPLDACQYPLVLLKQQQLICLQRNFQLEQKLATQLAQLARPRQQQTIKIHESTLNQDQQRACDKALHWHLSLICGGPGSGKTTSVFQLLIALMNQTPMPRVALAACTGKAAARLNQSLRQQMHSSSPAQYPLLENINLSAHTLHHLLGYSNRRQAFTYNAQHPLALDVLIIDEVSMLDFNLLHASLNALPENASLVLLGDKHQLPAIEHGDILSCLQQTPLKECISYLHTQYRFASNTAISKLLSIIQSADIADIEPQLENFLQAPPDESFSYIAYQQVHQQWQIHVLPALNEYFQCVHNPELSIAEKIQSIYKFQILCPFNDGEFGVANINLQIDHYFKQQLATQDKHYYNNIYSGRAIMVTKNSYTLDLFNGDIGIILTDDTAPDAETKKYAAEERSLKAYFIDNQNNVRAFSPEQLPEYTSCHAMSIHKAQGSEFDQVMLLVPPSNSAQQAQLLQRRLIYTGISRARQKLILCADKTSLIKACTKNYDSYNSLSTLLNLRLAR